MGHVKPLLRLADGLAAEGHRPYLAVRNLVVAGQATPRVPVLQAPTFFWKRRPPGSLDIQASFSDVLACVGFDRVDTLLPMVESWRVQLDLLRPDLVIADYSPALCLATYQEIPTLNVGFGFILPPTDQATFPPLIPGRPNLLPEEKIITVVQEVLEKVGLPRPNRLTEVFAYAEPFLTVLPEVDHYSHVRTAGHLGPLEPLVSPQSPLEEPRFFAYLKPEFQRFEEVLTALSRCGIPGQAFILGADPSFKTRWQSPQFEILDAPPPIDEVLPQVQVILHHGGINVTQQALAAGRPQLVFPMQLEQALTAKKLHELGVAHMLRDDFPVQHVVIGLRQLHSPRFVDRARILAEQIQSRGPWNARDVILERCRELLAQRATEES